MNYTNKVQEKVLKVTDYNGRVQIIFPRNVGGTTFDALSLLNSALRGKEPPMLIMHADGGGTTSRKSDFTYVNVYHIIDARPEMVEVPAEIQALYVKPSGETEEAEEQRLLEIKNYFETR